MTDRSIQTEVELEALERQLAVWGPNLERWPLASQQRFVSLLANNADAQQAMAQAAALERLVLDSPHVPPARFAAVRDGVLAAAKRERDIGIATAALAPASQRQQPATGTRDSHTVIAGPPGGRRVSARLLSGWSPFALAASLILGLAAGGLGLADQVTSPGTAVASAPSDEGAADEGAWAFAANTSDEEDSL